MDKQKDYIKKIHAETKRINIDKWNEGVRRNSDPGDHYTLQWIRDNGEEFDIKWEKCKCRTCLRSDECGWNELEECGGYEVDEDLL